MHSKPAIFVWVTILHELDQSVTDLDERHFDKSNARWIKWGLTTGGTQEWPQLGFRMYQPWEHPRSRVWWFRRRIPARLTRFGIVAREIKESLHTKHGPGVDTSRLVKLSGKN